MKLKIVLYWLLFGFPLNVGFSQTSLSINQLAGYQTNTFANYLQLPDYVDNMGLNFAHIFTTESLNHRIYYQGQLTFFKTYAERRFHAHELGYDGLLTRSAGQTHCYFGANFKLNDYRADYEIYDFGETEFYANLRSYLQHNWIGQVGYILRNKNYADFPEFSYWEHTLWVRFNTFFQTGTSLSLNFNYGLKDYQSLTQAHAGKRSAMNAALEQPAVDQMVSQFKLAQSLGMQTALSFSYLNRLRPGLVSGTAAVVTDGTVLAEDELFDDRYGYTGHELLMEFNQTYRGNFGVKVSARHTWKKYLPRQVYPLDGSPLENELRRNDQRSLIALDISRNFTAVPGIKNMKLSFEGGYLLNQSNDLDYRFENWYGFGGVEVGIR
ncbi:hypothetical protein L0128_03450 [candidate division KSB1 bacterium]|nr:hypothetical protein [candidate division KSB1 bacterium]